MATSSCDTSTTRSLGVDVGLIEIAEIEPSQDPRLRGSNIEAPRCGLRTDATALDMWGWILPDSGSLESVALVHAGQTVATVRGIKERPDILSAFPDAEDPLHTGFVTTFMLPPVRTNEEFLLYANVRSGRRKEQVPVVRLVVKRVWRESGDEFPLVSIVIPCYRQAHYLGEAIESCLAQTYPNVEIVVVDDGSPDNTGEVARRYDGARCVRQENQGLAAARNTGIRSTNGGLLVFLDADDRLLPDAIAQGVASLWAHPEAGFTAGLCECITADGLVIDGSQQPKRPEGDLLGAQLRNEFVWACSTVMYRRSLFEFVDPFDVEMDSSADYDLYLRVMRDNPVAKHEAIVAQYRKHGSAMTRDFALMLTTTDRVLRSHRGYFRRHHDYAADYAVARKSWREYYSLPLAAQIRVSLRARRWQEAGKALRALAVHDPKRLSAILKPGEMRLGAGIGGQTQRPQRKIPMEFHHP